MEILNRKARFEYNILREYVAGIQLLGTEVRSLRDGRASISEGFVFETNGELFLRGVRIDRIPSSPNEHTELRDRKLLLNKKEIRSISRDCTERGVTCVPLKAFDSRGKIKVIIATARGKKLYDKRETIRERDIKKQTLRDVKNS
jgi:SsrA-binding protein